MKKAYLLLVTFLPFATFAQKAFLLVGTYKSDKKEGISVFSFNGKTGAMEKVSEVDSYNSSFMCATTNQKIIYVNNQFDNSFSGGAVSSYAFDPKTGTLKFINQQPTLGNDPCYLALDKTEKWLAVANYQGSIAIFPVAKNGKIDSAKITEHQGSSIDTSRQKSAHPHSVYFSPDNKFLGLSILFT